MLAPLQRRQVCRQSLYDVQAEQVVHGGCDQRGRLVRIGIALDLLAIKQEQTGNTRRHELLDLLGPIVGRQPVELTIAQDLERLAAQAGATNGPASHDAEGLLDAVRGVAERELDPSLLDPGTPVNPPPQMLLVATSRPRRRRSGGTEQAELQRLEDRRLTAAV